MDFDQLLQLMVKKNGSDLFITAGVPPSMTVSYTHLTLPTICSV